MKKITGHLYQSVARRSLCLRRRIKQSFIIPRLHAESRPCRTEGASTQLLLTCGRNGNPPGGPERGALGLRLSDTFEAECAGVRGCTTALPAGVGRGLDSTPSLQPEERKYPGRGSLLTNSRWILSVRLYSGGQRAYWYIFLNYY